MRRKFDPVWTTLFFLLMVAAVVAVRAHAGEATLTWTAPTKNCDGSALTSLTGYDLLYGQGHVALPLTPLSKTITGLTPGTWWFSLASVTPAARSEFVTVTKVVAPAEFKTTSTTAYTIVKKPDGLVFLPMGTVPVGTLCNAALPIGPYFVIPRAAVTRSGTINPDVVVATCG
jgi:hypothetical protein